MGMSRCFLELVGWQKASKHADLIFQTKIKKGRDFCWLFCFLLTLILMQTGSFCQDKHDVLALLLNMVLAEGQGVSRMFEGRKYPSSGSWVDLRHLTPGSGVASTMRHFCTHQLTKNTTGEKKNPMMQEGVKAFPC